MEKRAFLLVGILLIALALSPSIVLADEVDLPEKTVFLGSWDWWYGGGPWTWMGPVSQVDAHYAQDMNIYYRVLVFENGTEKVLDRYIFGGTLYRTPYPGDNGFHFWKEGTIPAKTFEMTEPGDYSVELRHIEIPVPTVEKNMITDENSVVDWWEVERIIEKDAELDKSCTVAAWNICWKETKSAEGVTLSGRAEVYETYEFTIEKAAGTPDAILLKGPGTPFSQEKGEGEKKDEGAGPVQMAVVGGLVALGAGVLALQKKKVTVKTVLSAHGAKIENNANENAQKVRQIEIEYSRWWRGVRWGKKWAKIRHEEALLRRKHEAAMMAEMANIERMYTKDQKAEALESMVSEHKGKMRKAYETKLTNFEEELKAELLRDEKTGAAMSFTDGPPAVLKESKEFIPKENLVGNGAFNFIDALTLKEKYGYELVDALGVAYEKNWFVQAVNELAYEIEETQTARIKEADKYPWPLSNIVKFSAAFAKETGVATTALVGNGFFALGSVGVALADSVMNPDDAPENFSAMGGVLMGSLFHGANHMMNTVKEEDAEVGLGMIMSFVIAPEEVMLENSGRLARISGLTDKMKKSIGARSSRIVKREVHQSFEVGDKAVLKSIEHSETPILSELLKERMGELGTEWGKTVIDISEVPNDRTK